MHRIAVDCPVDREVGFPLGRPGETVRRSRSVRLSITLGLCALAACTATVTHQPDPLDSSTGIRYYRPAPYLLVYSNSKGGLKWQVLYLPDRTKLMTLMPSVVGGRAEVTLYFKNGMLVGESELGDTTEVPRAIIAAAQTALPLLAAAESTGNTVPAPYLYRIVVNDTTVQFIGEQGDTSVSVPINKSGS